MTNLIRTDNLSLTDATPLVRLTELHQRNLDAHQLKMRLIGANHMDRPFAFRRRNDAKRDPARCRRCIDVAVRYDAGLSINRSRPASHTVTLTKTKRLPALKAKAFEHERCPYGHDRSPIDVGVPSPQGILVQHLVEYVLHLVTQAKLGLWPAHVAVFARKCIIVHRPPPFRLWRSARQALERSFRLSALLCRSPCPSCCPGSALSHWTYAKGDENLVPFQLAGDSRILQYWPIQV